MSPTEDCAAFALGETTVTIGEVVRAAHFRGELQSAAAEVALAVACEEEAARWKLEADGDAIGAAADAFRFENDLTSAEAMEAWLGARGIAPGESRDYFSRRYWRETLREKIVPDNVDPARVVPEMMGLLEIEVLMSGAFGALATGLVRRLLVRAEAGASSDEGQVKAERAQFLKRAGLKPAGVPVWLRAVGRGPDWLGGMLAMEAAFRRRCAAVVTRERLAQALAAARLALTQLEVEQVEFDSADAARDAHLRVRQDGLALEAVARESRFPFSRLEFLAEDLPDELRQRLLCASDGEVLAPSPEGGVFHLRRVVRKAEPVLADARIRSRLERRILDAYFSGAGEADARWFVR